MTTRISRELARLACLAGLAFVGMLMAADTNSAAMTLVPARALFPDMSSVQNVAFSECHTSCHVENGTKYCTRVCSANQTIRTTIIGRKNSNIQRSTGPTLPPKPVETRGKNH
jgi:heterodisulfide reductase subunit A-like polyferredoxin